MSPSRPPRLLFLFQRAISPTKISATQEILRATWHARARVFLDRNTITVHSTYHLLLQQTAFHDPGWLFSATISRLPFFFLSRNLCQDSAYRTQDTCVTCHALSNRYSTVHIKTMTTHQNYLLYRTTVHVSKIPLSWILLLYRYFQLSSLKPSKPI